MAENLESVELFNAWRWDCTECGRENFERAIHISKELINECISIDCEDMDLMVFPNDVKCRFCGCRYITKLFGFGEEE